jgi:hypothetical protein
MTAVRLTAAVAVLAMVALGLGAARGIAPPATGFDAIGFHEPTPMAPGSPEAVDVAFGDLPLMMTFSLPASVMMNLDSGIGFSNGHVETVARPETYVTSEVSKDDAGLHSRMWIESQNAARIVVRWRAALVDPEGRIARSELDGRSPYGPGDWVDERYTIHPDATYTRAVRIYSAMAPHAVAHWGRDGIPFETQESCVHGPPGHQPSDDIEVEALTLITMDGSATRVGYRPYPGRGNLAVGANIQVVNLRSPYKPFTVVPEGDVTIRAYHGSDEDHGRVDETLVVAWPPVTRFDDGYTAALTHVIPWTFHDRSETTLEQVYLSGMVEADTGEEVDAVLPLARAWLRPPAVHTSGAASVPVRFDRAQRAYVLPRPARDDIVLRFDASVDSPLVRPAVVVTGWGDGPVAVLVDGEPARPGDRVRIGYEEHDGATDLVLWFDLEATEPTRLTIGAPRAH